MQESGGTVLAKFDVQGAFRTIPVHPDDRRLLGMVESMWPAPKLYNAVADTLLWILEKSDVVDSLHYLDDFLVFGAPDSQQCRECWPSVHSWECLWPLGRQKALA